MALNLRKKIADSDTLTVFDVNQDATKKFVEEAGSKSVQVASDPKEVAHKSVCPEEYLKMSSCYDERVLFYL